MGIWDKAASKCVPYTYEWPRRTVMDYIREWVMRRVVNDGVCYQGVRALMYTPLILYTGDYDITITRIRGRNLYNIYANRVGGKIYAHSDSFTIGEMKNTWLVSKYVHQAVLRLNMREEIKGYAK